MKKHREKLIDVQERIKKKKEQEKLDKVKGLVMLGTKQLDNNFGLSIKDTIEKLKVKDQE